MDECLPAYSSQWMRISSFLQHSVTVPCIANSMLKTTPVGYSFWTTGPVWIPHRIKWTNPVSYLKHSSFRSVRHGLPIVQIYFQSFSRQWNWLRLNLTELHRFCIVLKIILRATLTLKLWFNRPEFKVLPSMKDCVSCLLAGAVRPVTAVDLRAPSGHFRNQTRLNASTCLLKVTPEVHFFIGDFQFR